MPLTPDCAPDVEDLDGTDAGGRPGPRRGKHEWSPDWMPTRFRRNDAGDEPAESCEERGWSHLLPQDLDPYWPSLPASRSCPHPPGSAERILELQRRFERGESLQHPDDDVDFSRPTSAPDIHKYDQGIFKKDRRWMVRRIFNKKEYLSRTVATKDEARVVLRDLLAAVEAGQGRAWERKYGVKRRGKMARKKASPKPVPVVAEPTTPAVELPPAHAVEPVAAEVPAAAAEATPEPVPAPEPVAPQHAASDVDAGGGADVADVVHTDQVAVQEPPRLSRRQRRQQRKAQRRADRVQGVRVSNEEGPRLPELKFDWKGWLDRPLDVDQVRRFGT